MPKSNQDGFFKYITLQIYRCTILIDKLEAFGSSEEKMLYRVCLL